MPFLKCAIAATFACVSLTPADELSEALDALATSHGKLEGYQATYDAKTSTGKSGTIEIGVDFKSGWSYLISELKDTKGEVNQKGQQWTTGEGNYLMQSGERVVVFEGFGELGKRFSALADLMGREENALPARIKPGANLDQTGIQMGIGYTTGGEGLLRHVEKLVLKNDKEVRLQMGKFGEVTFDPQTGVLLSQTIKTDTQLRTLKRTAWVPNPGRDAIATKLNIELDGAPRRNLRESGMSQKFIREVLQNKIDAAARDKKLSDGMSAYLLSVEDNFVAFLDQEPLNKAGFIKNEFFFRFMDQAMAQTAARLKQDGKKIGAVDILTAPDSRRAFLGKLVDTFRKQAPPIKKQEYLSEVLNGKLEGEKGEALIARVLVEDFVERSYYRVRIGRAIDAYIQRIKGK